MKKVILLFALFASMSIMAEQQFNIVYCELVGTRDVFNGKVTVSIDFGQSGQMWHNQTMVDENGKPIKFNSMVDAMNWMGSKGWKFEQAYVVGLGNTLTYHWLLSKIISDEESVSDDGLKTRYQYKQEEKNQR